MHPSSSKHSSGGAAAPPRRPPRRYKSTSTAGSDMFSLDDISEVEVFRPRVPLRTKSCEELDAELLYHSGDDDDDGAAGDANVDIPASIDLSQLALNLHQIQLQQEDLLWDDDDDDDDKDLMDHNKNERSSPSSRSHRGLLGPTHSFLSVGSSMTAAQQREPGRFVTPASSFYNNANSAPILDCQGVQPVERVTVDPYQFLTSDMSFRLPLVGSLTDSHFVVSKKQKLNDNNTSLSEDKDWKKTNTAGGRKTIQLDAMTGMPTVSLDDDDDDDNNNHNNNHEVHMMQEHQASAESTPQVSPQQEPPARPIMFGKLQRESRRLVVRPNLPF